MNVDELRMVFVIKDIKSKFSKHPHDEVVVRMVIKNCVGSTFQRTEFIMHLQFGTRSGIVSSYDWCLKNITDDKEMDSGTCEVGEITLESKYRTSTILKKYVFTENHVGDVFEAKTMRKAGTTYKCLPLFIKLISNTYWI